MCSEPRQVARHRFNRHRRVGADDPRGSAGTQPSRGRWVAVIGTDQAMELVASSGYEHERPVDLVLVDVANSGPVKRPGRAGSYRVWTRESGLRGA